MIIICPALQGSEHTEVGITLLSTVTTSVVITVVVVGISVEARETFPS
jgi:hypothetical protein